MQIIQLWKLQEEKWLENIAKRNNETIEDNSTIKRDASVNKERKVKWKNISMCGTMSREGEDGKCEIKIHLTDEQFNKIWNKMTLDRKWMISNDTQVEI